MLKIISVLFPTLVNIRNGYPYVGKSEVDIVPNTMWVLQSKKYLALAHCPCDHSSVRLFYFCSPVSVRAPDYCITFAMSCLYSFFFLCSLYSSIFPYALKIMLGFDI